VSVHLKESIFIHSLCEEKSKSSNKSVASRQKKSTHNVLDYNMQADWLADLSFTSAGRTRVFVIVFTVEFHAKKSRERVQKRMCETSCSFNPFIASLNARWW
jgi:hypothetical protein